MFHSLNSTPRLRCYECVKNPNCQWHSSNVGDAKLYPCLSEGICLHMTWETVLTNPQALSIALFMPSHTVEQVMLSSCIHILIIYIQIAAHHFTDTVLTITAHYNYYGGICSSASLVHILSWFILNWLWKLLLASDPYFAKRGKTIQTGGILSVTLSRWQDQRLLHYLTSRHSRKSLGHKRKLGDTKVWSHMALQNSPTGVRSGSGQSYTKPAELFPLQQSHNPTVPQTVIPEPALWCVSPKGLADLLGGMVVAWNPALSPFQ